MFKIYFVDVDSIIDNQIDRLSFSRKQKSENYIFEKDKKLCLGAGVALDIGLHEFNLKEKDVKISYSKYGKPYLEDYPLICFNLSHSYKKAMCVISNKEVGCDIEHIATIKEKVANKMFSNIEKEYLKNSKNKEEDFYKIWVAKESFLKAIGTGITKNICEISIIFENNQIKINQNIDSRKWKIEESKRDNYIYAVCYQE